MSTGVWNDESLVTNLKLAIISVLTIQISTDIFMKEGWVGLEWVEILTFT